jgi:hypothetical protein
MPRKNQAKAKRAANLKLTRTIKASHRLSLKRARVKTLIRTSKVRPRGLAAIKRGKKSIRIQGLLAHGSAERVVNGDNNDSHDELSLESEHETDESNT